MTEAPLAKRRLFPGTNTRKKKLFFVSPLWQFTELELNATEPLIKTIKRFLSVRILRVVGPQCSVDTRPRLQTHYHSISLTTLAGISLHTHTGASVGCTVIINCLVTS